MSFDFFTVAIALLDVVALYFVAKFAVEWWVNK